MRWASDVATLPARTASPDNRVTAAVNFMALPRRSRTFPTVLTACRTDKAEIFLKVEVTACSIIDAVSSALTLLWQSSYVERPLTGLVT